jgi:hypothetical protein
VQRVVDDPTVPDAADGCDIGATERGGVDIAGLIFRDDFESGDTSRWSTTEP